MVLKATYDTRSRIYEFMCILSISFSFPPTTSTSDDIFQTLSLGDSWWFCSMPDKSYLKPGLQLPASAAAHQAAVKEMFVASYEAYQYVASFDVVPTLSRAETRLLV